MCYQSALLSTNLDSQFTFIYMERKGKEKKVKRGNKVSQLSQTCQNNLRAIR